MRVAVLDLGTNTFNLVVAEQNCCNIQLIHSSKLPVKLGEGGINKGTILPGAFSRGMLAVENHCHTIQKLGADQIKAYGTSALRTARNGKDFIEAIRSRTGIEIEIIDGDREAEMIYYGVRESFDMSNGKYLILDIGGGSNEFIIADNQTIFWKKSYPLGIARLLEQFKPSDPMTLEEINLIRAYLATQTEDLFEEVERQGVEVLLGASGSFETFAFMIKEKEVRNETENSVLPEVFPISHNDFEKLYQKLIHSTAEERKTMKGLEAMRREMIVLACLFVKFVVDNLQLIEIYQTNYSLKEGAIYQLLKQ
jgi:exopolyphosphatase / guanosine-5'-triphosphate,3'-diphosphate pyrophosphatase